MKKGIITMTKTKKLIGGILSAAVALSACSSREDIDVQDETTYTEDETYSTSYSEEPTYNEAVEEEIELDHLQSQYPDMDLEAMENYIEENGLEYQEDELITFLDDVYENGESTLDSNYYSNESSFPWWIFLLANTTKMKPTGKVNFTKSATTAPSNVKPATKPSTNVTTSPSSTGSQSGSGFGSGSKSSGS
jgi:hypothetical protein